jgi:hypothetical protein
MWYYIELLVYASMELQHVRDMKFFISPTNAHKLYKIVKLLKQLKS